MADRYTYQVSSAGDYWIMVTGSLTDDHIATCDDEDNAQHIVRLLNRGVEAEETALHVEATEAEIRAASDFGKTAEQHLRAGQRS